MHDLTSDKYYCSWKLEVMKDTCWWNTNFSLSLNKSLATYCSSYTLKHCPWCPCISCIYLYLFCFNWHLRFTSLSICSCKGRLRSFIQPKSDMIGMGDQNWTSVFDKGRVWRSFEWRITQAENGWLVLWMEPVSVVFTFFLSFFCGKVWYQALQEMLMKLAHVFQICLNIIVASGVIVLLLFKMMLYLFEPTEL